MEFCHRLPRPDRAFYVVASRVFFQAGKTNRLSENFIVCRFKLANLAKSKLLIKITDSVLFVR